MREYQRNFRKDIHIELSTQLVQDPVAPMYFRRVRIDLLEKKRNIAVFNKSTQTKQIDFQQQ